MVPPRIISGTAKGVRLQDVPGDTTRPVTDRVKEAFFNILGNDILDTSFLDLFGGTGSIGIEALSRGARRCTFIDLNAPAINTLKHNLRLTKLETKAQVHQMDAFRFLDSAVGEPYDYVYIAPPQYKQMWIRALQTMDQKIELLSEDAWVIVQIHPVELEEVILTHLHEFDRRVYGSTVMLFYARNDLQ